MLDQSHGWVFVQTDDAVPGLPKRTSLPQSMRSKLFLAQNKHIWLVPLRMMVGVAPAQSPRTPSSLTIRPAVCTGPYRHHRHSKLRSCTLRRLAVWSMTCELLAQVNFEAGL